MNIIAVRQERRRKHIEQIKASIKNGTNFNFKSVVLAAMSNLNISKRTAREYVEIAFFELGIDKDGRRIEENQREIKTNTE